MVAVAEVEKNIVLDRISKGKVWLTIDRARFRIDKNIIHIRFCSTDKQSSPMYKFNINPNTLSADYEVWICGNSYIYYLIPINTISRIYNDPESYVDRRHPEIRVVSVNVEKNTVTYARGGKTLNLTPYFRETLE